MKIFFALALVIFVNWSVVLGDDDLCPHCYPTNGGEFCKKGSTGIYCADSFGYTCSTTPGQSIHDDYELCNPTDLECGSGFTHTWLDLGGWTKEFSTPGEGIENCRNACLGRIGCTGFEYNHGGEEGYKCGTYTGGYSSIEKDYQQDSWWSCISEQCYTSNSDCADYQLEHGACCPGGEGLPLDGSLGLCGSSDCSNPGVSPCEGNWMKKNCEAVCYPCTGNLGEGRACNDDMDCVSRSCFGLTDSHNGYCS